ncbi:MAG TPA: NAD(P)/FAD-dependent oxidoreductase [Saprospiraceae bacterium]|nr:NAD(P)/FAD-dependent oxidoreductase [Saprospiraceae bacterium]HMQ85855.1 NAD(P)/FAD-dependent oxidoreductase [Saprospiraceae bacterium]
MSKNAVIAGAGLVGSLWAALLAKRGYQVDVFERRPDPRERGYIGGRSINLALSHRGWEALEKAGARETLEKIAIPMYGRMMHSVAGELTFQAYGTEGQAIYSVSRGQLNMELIALADKSDKVRFHFEQSCRRLDVESHSAWVENHATGEAYWTTCPLLFGADGAFSAVRNSLMKTPRFNYRQDYLDYAYKELSIPAGANSTHLIDKNALHIWPRGNFMLIALPNIDGSFTCTLFLPFEGNISFEQLHTDDQIQAFFQHWFPDVVPLIPDLVSDFHQNPTSALVTVRCSPWNYQDWALLIGDAAHAIVPFYGQGMNCGFEDCSVLDEMMDTYQEDWAAILSVFGQERVKDGNAIADLALRNFIEMRDLVADPVFLLRKKIEAHLHEKYPAAFLPVYSMVTFSSIPYSQAQKESVEQDALLKAILQLEGIEQNWPNDPRIDELFGQWLENKKA